MAEIPSFTVPASAAMRQITMNVTVKVTGQRWLQCRVWTAIQIMRVAALVAGCGIHVEPMKTVKE